MNVLMISLDRKLFEEGSAARVRMVEYGSIFTELHILVYTLRSSNFSPQQIAENVWVYPTNSKNKVLYIYNALKIAARIIRAHSVGVVSGQDACDTGISAFLIARKFNLPLHLQDHADVFNPAFKRESFGNNIRAVISRFLFARATNIRTVATESEKHLLQNVPSASGKTFLLPVYTDVEKLRTSSPTFSLSEKYPNQYPLLFTAGRFVPQKNLTLTLLVLSKLRNVFPTAGIILVGEGPLKAELEAYAQNLGIQDFVHIEPWQEDLVPYYRGADVFIMTSHYESYGRTLVEAAAADLPFVSTNVGIASDLAHAGAGMVCADESTDSFVEAIQSLLKEGKKEGKGLDAVKALQGNSMGEYLARYKEMMEECVPNTMEKTKHTLSV